MRRNVCALLILRHCGKSQHSLPNIYHFVLVCARRASASRTFSTQARSSFNGIKFTIRSGGIFAAKAAARARSMNSNCQRPGDGHAAKHRRLRSLRGKGSRRFRHYWVGSRCALAIQRAGDITAMDHPRWPTAAFLLPPPGPVRKSLNYCALTLIKVFASSVSFLSVAPSSSSVCCKSLAPLVSPSNSAYVRAQP